MWAVNNDCSDTLATLLVLFECDGTALTLQNGETSIDHGAQEILPRGRPLRFLAARWKHVVKDRHVVMLYGNKIERSWGLGRRAQNSRW